MDTVSGDGPPGRLPNLIIAGVSKGGTTSLYTYLSQHPDVCASDVKELRYFSALRHGQPVAPLDEYAAHFAHCGAQRYAVEATPGYFYGGADVAAAINETCPDARVVVSLRSPADRCWSWFRFVKSRTRIPKHMTFEAYLDRCEQLHRAGVDGDVEHQPFWGLGGGCYDSYLEPWIEEFGDRLRILFFDDIVRDPQQVVRDLCRWLDLDPGGLDDVDFRVENKTEQYRNRTVQRAAVGVNKRTERFFSRHPATKRVLRSGYYAVNRPAAELTMPALARTRMQDFFDPHNSQLAFQLAKIGMKLPEEWMPSNSPKVTIYERCVVPVDDAKILP